MISQARKILCNLACGPIPRMRAGIWSDWKWEPQTAAYFPSVGQDLQVGYAGPQPKRLIRSFPKLVCVFGLDIYSLMLPANSAPGKPGDIVQDDVTLQTWYVMRVRNRVMDLALLTPAAPVGTAGNFVVASLSSEPR